MSKKVLVLGLGNFGSELARRLTLEDIEVTGVDINHHLVDLYKDSITNVIEGDATKDEVMKELEVSLYDFCIVCIGHDVGISLTMVALLKKYEAKSIYARAINNIHWQILSLLRVKYIFQPEIESAGRLAMQIASKIIYDAFPISKNFIAVEINIPRSYENLKLGDIKINDDINILMLKRYSYTESPFERSELYHNPSFEYTPTSDPKTLLHKNDRLVLFGPIEKIREYVKIYDKEIEE